MIASTARRASAILLALAIVVALAAPATAAPQPAVVVWAGDLSPGTPLHGVILKASGSGQRLEVREADRSTGKVTTAGAFAPTPAQLAAIRAAAKAATGAPTITSAPSREHGGYASATIQSGDGTKTVLGLKRHPAATRRAPGGGQPGAPARRSPA